MASTALSPRANTTNKFSPLLHLEDTDNNHSEHIAIDATEVKQKILPLYI